MEIDVTSLVRTRRDAAALVKYFLFNACYIESLQHHVASVYHKRRQRAEPLEAADAPVCVCGVERVRESADRRLCVGGRLRTRRRRRFANALLSFAELFERAHTCLYLLISDCGFKFPKLSAYKEASCSSQRQAALPLIVGHH